MNWKLLVWVVSAAIAMSVAVAGVAIRKPVTYNGTHLSPPMPTTPFTLESGSGTVSLADLNGRAVVLFFGYTSCPDICPTSLLRLDDALDKLGRRAEDVQVVFVSVDPERDTPERAHGYATAVDPRFVGLSGSPQEIEQVASQFGIYHARAEGSVATGYSVDHTATMTVLDRQGRVALLWGPEVGPAAMAEDLRALLAD